MCEQSIKKKNLLHKKKCQFGNILNSSMLSLMSSELFDTIGTVQKNTVFLYHSADAINDFLVLHNL